MRLYPARGELCAREDVWSELEQRGASIARVPFVGRSGRGGWTSRIELLRVDGTADALAEVEVWSSRDELCFALEAPVWARFGTFVGHPPITGEVVWFGDGRTVELIATRGGRRLEERLS
ncbi:MAG TPA: hypothetical protein VFN65_11910 [Solirubrobacteraceae bacterium]|nr:hypothetical protein [Solirubrobacteraceae bacterium]